MQGLAIVLPLLLQFPAEPGVPPMDPIVVQQASLKFSGRVVDDRGQAVSGAEVLIFAPSGAHQVRGRSDQNGQVNIIIPNLGEPRYYVVATKNGYITDKAMYSIRDLGDDGFILDLVLLRQ